MSDMPGYGTGILSKSLTVGCSFFSFPCCQNPPSCLLLSLLSVSQWFSAPFPAVRISYGLLLLFCQKTLFASLVRISMVACLSLYVRILPVNHTFLLSESTVCLLFCQNPLFASPSVRIHYVCLPFCQNPLCLSPLLSESTVCLSFCQNPLCLSPLLSETTMVACLAVSIHYGCLPCCQYPLWLPALPSVCLWLPTLLSVSPMVACLAVSIPYGCLPCPPLSQNPFTHL